MRKFEKYFVVTIAITMILMANTVNAAFNLIPLLKAQSTLESSHKDFKPQLPQSNNNFSTSSKEMQNGRSESDFLDFWKSGVSTPENSANGVSGYSDFLSKDKDLAELVIGVNLALPNAYNNIVNKISNVRGKVVNTVSARGEVFAIVADVPLNSAYPLIKDVQTNKLAQYIEPNRKFQALLVPNDQYWSLQWGPQKIQADLAWDTTIGASSVLVAVIDTGIDYSHPDLAGNYVTLGYNWVNGTSDPRDDNGHGTHCAGIIAAELNNAIGIAGLAQVKIMAEKAIGADGSGYEDDLAKAIIHAVDQGAKILSNSWGAPSDSMLIHEAIQYAYNNGVLVIAAAGNSATNTKFYPAAYDEVVAVTATDQADAPASFTSYGNWVELAAPGVGIYSTTPTYHVTLNDQGVAMNYDYLSGTSMACPHVAGVAALVWSEFSNMSRDVLRLRLRDTADDLGTPGFDIYYGYGRVNARRALTEPLPAHDIVIGNLEKPLYIEPGKTGIINATVINYGSNNEINVNVQWLVNSSLVQSSLINMTSEASTDVSLSWTPTTVGNYNVTVYAVPVAGETNTANNIVQGYVYVGIPLKVFVLRSAGTQLVTDAWDALNNNWKKFGNQLIYIDYTTLDKDNITYNDLKATGADVLILSCAYAWEYTDQEIAAIKQYVYEGHGFIVTAGTFYYQVPNNTKFAPMLGINGSNPNWSETGTDLLDILQPSHPLFVGVPNPYTMPSVGTALPYDGAWSSNELAGGTYVAMGHLNESAIVVYRGLVYISPWLEEIPDYYNFNLQILYNAMTWSKYQKPQHELVTSLQAPTFVFPNSSVLLNATVTNEGVQNESDVKLSLSLTDKTRNETVYSQLKHISLLQSGENYTLSFWWNQTMQGVYNATAYAVPVSGEDDVTNNKVTVLCLVAPPLIQPQEGQWANYKLQVDITGQQTEYARMILNYSKYVSPYLMNVTLLESISGYPSNITQIGWTTVNIIDRFCEEGAWKGLWFPGRIETNITVGSSVNVLNGPAAVIGSEALVIGIKIADCWKLFQNYPGFGNYTWWYDKTNGLWIKMVATISSGGMALNEVIMLDSTNIPTGYTPAHELRVMLGTPNFVALGNSSTINATVFNYGLNNETNVHLALEINGTTVKSRSVPKLVVNASGTISYLWTPPNEAVYNVTAYAQPVLGENITSDNTATAIVKVQAVKGYVLFDQTHMTNSIDMYSTWITNLRNKGYVVNLYNNSTGSITSTVLEGYNAFVTINAQMSYSDAELGAIKEFVDKGAGLLVIGGGYPDFYTSLTAFAGITWTYGGVSGFTTNITPHEVTQGVSQVYLFWPTTMMNLNGSAQALVRDNYMEIMLAVNWHGGGRVMGFADQYSLSNFAIGMADNLQLATNMIAWLCEKDTTPPQILLITPSNGTLIGTTSIAVNWTATDSQSGIDKYSIYRNGQFVANTTIQSYTVPNLIEGSNNVTIVAYDRAGNHASVQVTIIADLTPLTIAILSPADNSYVRQTVAINVSGYDVHFNHMELRVDANLKTTFDTSGMHTYLWNTTSESYSTHQITLTGYDAVGNNASTTITVTVDNLPPTVSIVSPANNAFVRGNLTIKFIARDPALKNASLMIGSNVTYNVAGNASQPFNTKKLSDGNYEVKLVAYDWAGNKAETSITITIDNTPPEIYSIQPSNGTAIGTTTVTMYWMAIDNESGIDKYSIYRNGQFVENTTLEYYMLYNLVQGSNNVTIAAYDRVGNSASDYATITVDLTPPTISIKSPQNGAVLSRKATINFSTTDNYPNPVTVFLYINNTQIGMYSDQGSYVWDTTKVTDGNYTIKAVATDFAGNTKESALTVTVSNAPPAYITYTGYAAAGILGLALGALAVWLLLKRKLLLAPTATTPTT